MDSLNKAFAHKYRDGTTLKEDPKIAKRLVGWDPDADVRMPPQQLLNDHLPQIQCAALI